MLCFGNDPLLKRREKNLSHFMIPFGGNKATAKSWVDGWANELTWLQIGMAWGACYIKEGGGDRLHPRCTESELPNSVPRNLYFQTLSETCILAQPILRYHSFSLLWILKSFLSSDLSRAAYKSIGCFKTAQMHQCHNTEPIYILYNLSILKV